MAELSPELEISGLNVGDGPDALEIISEQVAAVQEKLLPRGLHVIKRSAQSAVVLGELSPANEAIRLGMFGAGEVMTHSPVVGALTLGLSTLAIEGAAALSTASLYNTEASQRSVAYMRNKLAKLGYGEDRQLSKSTIAGLTFLGGSVVGMSLEKFNNPDQTIEENRRAGLVSAAWLAGVCAVAGAMGSEAVDYAIHNPVSALIVGGGIGASAAKNKIASIASSRRSREDIGTPESPTTWLDYKRGVKFGVVQDPAQLEKAAVLEQQVWDEKNYGNLEEEGYLPHIANSRTFAAFEKGECVGVNRMFTAKDGLLPPFLDEEMPYDDESKRAEIAELATQGLVEELGTVAVPKKLRGKGVNLRLWRLAYRDARARGIQKWGIIMEPERVKKMNENQGFTFEQLGDAIPYQGGDCAAFIMDLEQVDESMHKQHPLNHYWFVKKKIRA